MENDEEAPGRGRGSRRRVLIAGGAVLVGALTLLPWERTAPPPPAAGPGAQAHAAVVAAGVPAALPEPAALIGEREARLRARPGDARSWAVLGAAHVEQGRRTADPAYYPRAETAPRTSLRGRGKWNAEALGGLAALANARRDFRAALSELGEPSVADVPTMDGKR
jgi:cytochrome c-type biogenesis protein CcmH/NrfG